MISVSLPLDARSSPLREWWGFVGIPLAVFACAFLLIEVMHADVPLAQALFYAADTGWLGAHNWWTNEFVHDGGRWLVRLIVAATVFLHIATYMGAPRAWRRPSGYFALACILGVGTVGLLKATLHIPCPWDLKLFGGQLLYLPLFVRRLHAGHISGCFPAAHSASGYVLSSGYFALREYRARWANWALWLGVTIGLVFGIAQQSRGAHFLSHDLCSAMLTWLVAASLYVFAFKSSLWPAWQGQTELLTMAHPPGAPSSLERTAPSSTLQPPAAPGPAVYRVPDGIRRD